MINYINKHNYQEFIDFCKATEECNNEDFEESRLIHNPNGSLQYTGTYRDMDRNPYHVTFDEKTGLISYISGLYECMNELDTLYMEMFRTEVRPNIDSQTDHLNAFLNDLDEVAKKHGLCIVGGMIETVADGPENIILAENLDYAMGHHFVSIVETPN